VLFFAKKGVDKTLMPSFQYSESDFRAGIRVDFLQTRKNKNVRHLKNYDDKIDLNISAKRKILHTP